MLEEAKACIWCGESIKAEARICRFCNREQVDAGAETVIYQGPGALPIPTLVVDAMLVLACGLGLVTGAIHLVEHARRTYKVTTKRVEIHQNGLVTRKVEVLDLYRVRDVRFESSWGRGQIEVLSSDVTTPRLTLALPNARAVFDQLQPAIGVARRVAGVRVAESG